MLTGILIYMAIMRIVNDDLKVEANMMMITGVFLYCLRACRTRCYSWNWDNIQRNYGRCPSFWKRWTQSRRGVSLSLWTHSQS